MMKSKIHGARVTATELHYEGSIAIDSALMDRAKIFPNEQVEVYNVNTGARFQTYAIAAPANSQAISVNGAAARLAQPGDELIIVTYAILNVNESGAHQPVVVRLSV